MYKEKTIEKPDRACIAREGMPAERIGGRCQPARAPACIWVPSSVALVVVWSVLLTPARCTSLGTREPDKHFQTSVLLSICHFAQGIYPNILFKY